MPMPAAAPGERPFEEDGEDGDELESTAESAVWEASDESVVVASAAVEVGTFVKVVE